MSISSFPSAPFIYAKSKADKSARHESGDKSRALHIRG
jgi:hypothetical protein